ncbi:MAG: ATP-binding protein [Planctomycetota bacterium]
MASEPQAPGRTESRVPIQSDADVVVARQKGRARAAAAGRSGTGLTVVAPALAELARNIVAYAVRGEVVLRLVESAGRRGIEVVARDQGPGIADVALALQDGYSTGHGLGLGLPGTRRLMDEFSIQSAPGKGTIISVRKWAHNRP